jgi:hypothetical protein
MEAFGREREAELRKFLELPQGIPDGSMFIFVDNGSEGTSAA